MDERLEAGRHHLDNGERALQQGYPDDARAHFHSALLQFAGPDLLIGEAHALRGLAQVELSTGRGDAAEKRLREAIARYQEVPRLLEAIDTSGVSHELRDDAREGEGAALVLLAEHLVRSGRNKEAREELAAARAIYNALGERPSAASVWHAIGRVAVRDGRYAEAQEAYDRSREIHEKSGDLAGQAAAWLALAELRRMQRDAAASALLLGKALPLARQSGSQALEGRVRAALGALALQSLRLQEARDHYSEALPLLQAGGDLESRAFALLGLGDVRTRTGDGAAVDDLLEGGQILGVLRNRHGVAIALLRMAEYGARFREPIFALTCAEGARRIWEQSDPARGMGMALRLIVKAFAALKRPKAVLTAALARAQLAGQLQPNAVEVASFYRRRAPEEWLGELSELSEEELLERTRARVEDVLRPVLLEIGHALGDLDVPEGALDLARDLAERLPRPAPPEDWDEGPTDRTDAALDRAAASEEGPPEEEAEVVMQVAASSVVPPTEPVEVEDGEFVETEPSVPVAFDDETDAVPDVDRAYDDALPADEPLAEAAAGSSSDEAAAPPAGYEGLYAPVATEADLSEPEEEEEEEGDEDDEDVALDEALRRGPPPPGYDDLYDPPSEDDE